MKKSSFFLALLLMVSLVACNLPSSTQATPSSPDAAFTQAAQTVAAELTNIALAATPTSNIPTDTLAPSATFTLQPSNTPAYSPTNTPQPCLMVGFNNSTIDQTYPDNSIVAPGQVFVKTWRLINLGTCTWNSSYQLVFDHGDSIGVTDNYAQAMTAGNIAPGQSVDVSVTLTAPATSGTYTGYWRFRDPNGINFGINGTQPWIVKIKVVNTTTVTLTPKPVESGTFRADGGPFPDFTIGESNADINKLVQTFLSYDISSIPSNATITEVKINFSVYSTEGNPFGLGVLNGYVTDYGSTLEVADFALTFPPGNTLDWGSLSALNSIEVSSEMKTALQSKLGTTRLQLRLQFPNSNGNAVKDRLTLTNPSLVIKYVTP